VSQSITKSASKLAGYEDIRRLDRIAVPLINGGMGVEEAYLRAADELDGRRVVVNKTRALGPTSSACR
jgi:hypothetical protein